MAHILFKQSSFPAGMTMSDLIESAEGKLHTVKLLGDDCFDDELNALLEQGEQVVIVKYAAKPAEYVSSNGVKTYLVKLDDEKQFHWVNKAIRRDQPEKTAGTLSAGASTLFSAAKSPIFESVASLSSQDSPESADLYALVHKLSVSNGSLSDFLSYLDDC